MKIIDKTQFQNEQGRIDFFGRVQGTLKYGPTWYPEALAQRRVVAQLDRLLEKGFVLIRNFNLPGSAIIVPLLLVGPNGLSVIYVTHLKGFYQAQGDQWNHVDQGRPIAAPVNLLNRVVRLARATQVYLDRQKISVPAAIEPVLIAADPGLQIESMRPIARVVMSDAIKQFASGLLQGRPLLRPEQVYDLADRILKPRDYEAPAPLPVPQAASSDPGPSRARAIFDAAKQPGEAPAFDSSDLSFAFEDDETSPSRSLPAAGAPAVTAASRLPLLGMKPAQLGCLVVMLLFECFILAAAGYYIFFLNR